MTRVGRLGTEASAGFLSSPSRSSQRSHQLTDSTKEAIEWRESGPRLPPVLEEMGRETVEHP